MKNIPQARRLFQFRVRTLLFLMIGLSIPLAWVAHRLHVIRNQRFAVEEIERAGGGVQIFEEFLTMEVVSLYLRDPIDGPPVIDDQFLARMLPKFADLGILQFQCRAITGASLESIGKVKQLAALNLQPAMISGPYFQHLSGMSQLESLSFRESNLTDADLRQLKNLVQLRVLELASPDITDQGLAHLSGLTNLELLDLSSPQITDAGLAHLRHLKSLTALKLSSTVKGQVTPEGISQLRAYFPNCKIDGPTYESSAEWLTENNVSEKAGEGEAAPQSDTWNVPASADALTLTNSSRFPPSTSPPKLAAAATDPELPGVWQRVGDKHLHEQEISSWAATNLCRLAFDDGHVSVTSAGYEDYDTPEVTLVCKYTLKSARMSKSCNFAFTNLDTFWQVKDAIYFIQDHDTLWLCHQKEGLPDDFVLKAGIDLEREKRVECYVRMNLDQQDNLGHLMGKWTSGWKDPWNHSQWVRIAEDGLFEGELNLYIGKGGDHSMLTPVKGRVVESAQGYQLSFQVAILGNGDDSTLKTAHVNIHLSANRETMFLADDPGNPCPGRYSVLSSQK